MRKHVAPRTGHLAFLGLALLALNGITGHAVSEPASPDRAERWAKCIGYLDAIALMRVGPEFLSDLPLTADWPDDWQEMFEITPDTPYGATWLDVRPSAIRGLEILAGPNQLPELTVVQLAQFVRSWTAMEDVMASGMGAQNLVMVTDPVASCFEVYDELVAEGVIAR